MPTSPLNQVLYDRLREEFGKVVIAQAGMAAVTRHGYGHFVSEQKIRLQVDNGGEYLRVNCPYCGDARGRLWINHLWGVPDEVTGNKNLWLAICYNENCLAVPGRTQELYDRVYGFKNAKLRGRQPVILQGEVESAALQAVQPPGVLLPLDKLPPNNKVITYLQDRGIDPVYVQNTYGVSYCLDASADYPMAQDRLVIPIYMHNMLVGWQCRYPADLDWKSAGVPKYYSRPNMPRRLMLYNYDNAKKFPFVVLCEGPTDPWNVGPYAVAAFGKSISFPQIKLLCDTWADGAIVILLDGDAWNSTVELSTKLKDLKYKGHIIPVRLPVDKDPGSLDISLNNDFIYDAATKAGVDLLSMRRIDDNSIGSSTGPSLFGGIDRFRREIDKDNNTESYTFDVPRNLSAGSGL